MSGKSFEVHLVEGESAVDTEYVDFYDSGVWVDLKEGREFYPYEQVAKVVEIPESEGESEPTGVQ
jgi:hypothetical protein